MLILFLTWPAINSLLLRKPWQLHLVVIWSLFEKLATSHCQNISSNVAAQRQDSLCLIRCPIVLRCSGSKILQRRGVLFQGNPENLIVLFIWRKASTSRRASLPKRAGYYFALASPLGRLDMQAPTTVKNPHKSNCGGLIFGQLSTFHTRTTIQM